MKRKKRLEQECEEIEVFVDSIEDGETRRILNLYYIRGIMGKKIVTQHDVAVRLYIDQSTVSRRIDEFFKLA